MNKIKSYSINLNDETCAYLKELSSYLGVKEEDIIKSILEVIPLYFNKTYVKEKVDNIVKSFKKSKLGAFEFEFRDALHFGTVIRRDFETFFKQNNFSSLWPSIEEFIWFENNEGIQIIFYPDKSEFISEVFLTIFTNDSDYIQVWSTIGFRDDLKDKYDEIKKAFTKVIECVEEETLFEELQEDMSTDLEVNIYDDGDILSLVLEGCLNDRTLPDFMKVERLFKKLYKKAFPKKLTS